MSKDCPDCYIKSFILPFIEVMDTDNARGDSKGLVISEEDNAVILPSRLIGPDGRRMLVMLEAKTRLTPATNQTFANEIRESYQKYLSTLNKK